MHSCIYAMQIACQIIVKEKKRVVGKAQYKKAG